MFLPSVLGAFWLLGIASLYALNYSSIEYREFRISHTFFVSFQSSPRIIPGFIPLLMILLHSAQYLERILMVGVFNSGRHSSQIPEPIGMLELPFCRHEILQYLRSRSFGIGPLQVAHGP